MLGRIERLDCIISQHPIWQRVSFNVGFKAIKKCMHSGSKPKSGRLGQTAESQGKDGGRIAIPYKFPTDDSFSFAFGSCGCGAVCHSCSNTRGGSQTKMRPVVWNPAGPVTKSIDPPLRPFMTALLLNHNASSLGSVIAFQTTSRGCASHRSYLRVAYRPSIITSPLWLIAFIPFLLLCFWTGAAQVHQGCPTRTPCTWLSMHLVLPEPLAGGCISSAGHESERSQGRHL